MNAIDHTARFFRNPTLAERILAGDLPEYATHPLWPDRVWIAAATAAQDCDDESELRDMLDRQERFDAANERQARDAWRGRELDYYEEADPAVMRSPWGMGA